MVANQGTDAGVVLQGGFAARSRLRPGSLEFFHVVAGETTVTVPGFANGPTNPDTHAAGGISSIREFCPPGTNLPDSGTTAMLLGSALTGLGLVRRYWKR